MKFEFDPRKNSINKKKHGIDFGEAQVLWEDRDRLQVPARTEEEPRFMLIGKIGNKHWSAAFTVRNGRIRIISVRRARTKEIEKYES